MYLKHRQTGSSLRIQCRPNGNGRRIQALADYLSCRSIQHHPERHLPRQARPGGGTQPKDMQGQNSFVHYVATI